MAKKLTAAERRIVDAAMAWLRWMEKVQRADAWLREKSLRGASAIPNLLRATDSYRTTLSKKKKRAAAIRARREAM